MASEISSSIFEVDTAVQLSETIAAKADDLTFKCNLDGKWHIMGNLHGGYLAAIMLRALSQALPHPHPSTVTVFFIRRGKAGPAEVLVNKIKTDGNFSFGEARLVQNGVEIARTVGAFTVLEDNPERNHTAFGVKPPELDPIDQCVDSVRDKQRFGLFNQVQLLYTPDTRFEMAPTNKGEIKVWMRLREAQAVIDSIALGLLLDSNTPPGHHLAHPSLSNYPDYRTWYPTLGLTMYFRRKPKPNLRLVKGIWHSKYLVGRTLEVSGAIWDSDNNLLAQVHQLSVPMTSKL